MGFWVSAAEAGESQAEIPFPPEVYGLGALGGLLLLLALTFAFRSVGKRQRH
ncbi:MAG: hypothetical protein ACOYXW_13680 [Actinomycetota bacterium]